MDGLVTFGTAMNEHLGTVAAKFYGEKINLARMCVLADLLRGLREFS